MTGPQERFHVSAFPPPILRFGGFSLDRTTRRLTGEAEALHLTPKAFDLLSLLADQAPRVVPKTELHKHLWPDSFVSDSTLLGLVKEVRRALGDQGRGELIRTVHWVGYALAVEVERIAPGSSPSSAWVTVGDAHVPLNEGENLIGRDPGCVVRLVLHNISRRHARIVLAGNEATIEDLDSTNGTRLGSGRLTQPTVLRDGDLIQVGAATLTFHVATANEPVEPPPTSA